MYLQSRLEAVRIEIQGHMGGDQTYIRLETRGNIRALDKLTMPCSRGIRSCD